VQQIATGRVYGKDKLVAIHLYDSDTEKKEELEDVALDLVDLASPVLYEVRVAESVKDAVDSVSVAFILDYPYQPVVREESKTCMQQLEDPGMAQEEGKVEGEGENEDAANIQDSSSKEEPISSTTDDLSKLEGPTRGEEEGKIQDEGGEAEAKKPSSAGVEKQGSHSTLPVIQEEQTAAMDTATDKSGDTVNNAESASLPQANQSANDAPPTELTTPPELAAAAQLYHCYGATMDFCSQKDVQVVVCGRYANTGAALMANVVSSIDKSNFIAAPCLAEQQAKAIIASKVELNGADIAQVAVWGHSCGEKVATDLSYVRVKHFPGAVMGPDPFDLPLTRCIFQTEWLESKYHRLFEARHKRMEGYRRNGCALVEAMGLVKLANQWKDGDTGGSGWSSVGVVSTEEGGGVYGIPVGVVFCQPAQCSEGAWKPVTGLPVSDKIKVRAPQKRYYRTV
jgi:malate/lactate dehydrogenase